MTLRLMLVLLSLFGWNAELSAQYYLTKQQASDDIDYFFNQAKQIHPNLYFRISETELLRCVELTKTEIPDSISIEDFSRKMVRLANLIGDGHTRVYFPYTLQKRFRKEPVVLPFRIRLRDDAIVVDSSFTPNLRCGDTIRSLNGISSARLWGLLGLVGGDVERVKVDNLEKYFSYFFFMEYRFVDSIAVEVFRDNTLLSVNVGLRKYNGGNPHPKYSFRLLADSIGLITLNSFYAINKWHYLHFLDSTFEFINSRGIDYLVIDLRNNGGGNSYYGALLLPYIDVTTYRFNRFYAIKTSKPEKKHMRKRFFKWYYYPLYPLAFFSRMGRTLLFKRNGTLTELQTKDSRLKAHGNPYSGKVFLLTSGTTYSAAADFVVAFRYAQRGLVVGDTLGQPYAGYIDKIPVQLPESKLLGGVSYTKYEFIGTTGENLHKGVEPDVYVNPETLNGAERIAGMLTGILKMR